MRWFLSFVAGILALALVICGIIFVVENAMTRSYSFLGATMSLPLWAVLGLAALTGFLIALLVVTPARVAADASHAELRSHARRLDRDLTDTRTANERLQSRLTTLQAEHAVATRERDVYRERFDGLRAAPPEPEERERAESLVPASAPQATPETAAAPQESVVERRETDVVTPGQVETARESEPAAAPASQGGLGERLRTLFGKPDVANQDETPQGPAVPA